MAVCEALDRLTPGDHAKKSALFNSGAEAVENAVKIARAHTGRDAVVVFDHAYHGRTNLTMAMTPSRCRTSTASARSPARSTARRCPTRSASRAELTGAQAAAPRHRRDREAGRRRRPGLRRDRADPGRGRLRRTGARLPARARASGARDNGVVFVADEIQTGFVPHRRDVRLRARGRRARPRHHGQGHRRRPAARRGHRPRRDHGRRARRRAGRHVRRQPGRLRRRARRDRDDGAADLPPGPARSSRP